MGDNGKLFYEVNGEKRPVGRPKKEPVYTSPYPTAFAFSEPEAQKTELTTRNQIRNDEGTLIWGQHDDLPVSILRAISESPTTTSCIGKIEQYTRGEAFSDEGLMSMAVNKDGQTLWDFHCSLVPYFVSLDGFTTNFKFNSSGKITNAYCMATDGFRFVAEPNSTELNCVKFNPYFGTSEYRNYSTLEFPLFDINKIDEQIKEYGTQFPGQIYFHAVKRALFKHYPVPKFWAGAKWIYSDAKMATYLSKLLDNGFFSSVLMNVIGNPNAMSQHPDSMKEVTGTDGTIRKEPTKTEGQIFGEMMASNFSGVEKAAKALVTWSANHDTAVKIQEFPRTIDFDFISGTLREIIRMITISTECPGILANLPDEVSPLSGQDSFPNAVQFMQSNTAWRRITLENYYNNVLLANMEKKTKAKVQIKPFSQVKNQVTVDDKFWEFMNEAEKIDFIKRNEPNIVINRPPVAEQNTVSPTVDENGDVVPAPVAPQIDENLKNMKVSEINRILSYRAKYQKGELTLDQAKQLLSGFGLSEEQQTAWLNESA